MRFSDAESRPLFWRLVLIAFIVGGVYAIYVRAASGLGSATMLDDQFTWGFVVGLNVLCGLSIAVGGFTSAAAVRLLKLEIFQPIYRAAVITAFLGYLLALPAMLFDLGATSRAWAILLGGWSTRHVLSGALWCLGLYAAVLLAEFLPVIFPHVTRRVSSKWVRLVPSPLLLAAATLSMVHLYSLVRVILSAPGRRSPLWQTEYLPVLFFLSGIWAFLALLVFISWHTGRVLGKRFAPELQQEIGKVMAMLLTVYLIVRFADLADRGVLPALLQDNLAAVLLGVELSLILAPTVLLFRSATRKDAEAMYACSALAIAGFIANQLNVTITSVEAELGIRYVPRWTEVLFSYSLIAVGVGLIFLAVKHLQVFECATSEG
jgi:Ni/Fe-hydrogenase subunit HybB-like protein